MSDNWNPPPGPPRDPDRDPDGGNGADDGNQPPSTEPSGQSQDGSGQSGWWSQPGGQNQPPKGPEPGQQAPWETPGSQGGQQAPWETPNQGQTGPGQQPPWQTPAAGQSGQQSPWQQSPSEGQPSPWQSAGPGQPAGGRSGPQGGQYGAGQHSSPQGGQQNWSSGQGDEHQTQNWPITPQPEQPQQPPRPQGDPGQGWQHGGQQGGQAGPRAGADVPTGWQFPPPQRGTRGGGGGGGGRPYSPLMTQIPIPQPPGPGRRRRRRRRMRALLIGGVALAVLLAATGVTLALRGDDDPIADPGTTPSQTPSQTPTPTPTSQPTSSAPAPKPTPPKPKEPTALELVTRNKLYTTGLLKGAAGCREPNFRPTSYDSVRRYYNALLPCMNRAWYYALKKGKLQFRGPKVVVYAGVISTLCGPRRGDRAYYCAGNETIYMPWTVDNANWKRNQAYARAFMANTFAHEYGHHVQQLTGIMDASWRRQRAYKIPAGALQESRRRELQASCFGSVYLGANKNVFPMKGDVLTMWRFTVDHSGDEYSKPRVRDHGSRITHGWWSRRGFNGMNPGLCNTWSASPNMTR
jgi:predicted metalloprotease